MKLAYFTHGLSAFKNAGSAIKYANQQARRAARQGSTDIENLNLEEGYEPGLVENLASWAIPGFMLGPKVAALGGAAISILGVTTGSLEMVAGGFFGGAIAATASMAGELFFGEPLQDAVLDGRSQYMAGRVIDSFHRSPSAGPLLTITGRNHVGQILGHLEDAGFQPLYPSEAEIQRARQALDAPKPREVAQEPAPIWSARVPEDHPEYWNLNPVGEPAAVSREGVQVLDPIGRNRQRINDNGDYGGAARVRLRYPDGSVRVAAMKAFPLARTEDYQPAQLTQIAVERGLAKGDYYHEVRRMEDGSFRLYVYTGLVGENSLASGDWTDFPKVLNERMTPEQRRTIEDRVNFIRGHHPDPNPGNVLWELSENGSIHVWGVDWDHPLYRGELNGRIQGIANLAPLPSLDVRVPVDGLIIDPDRGVDSGTRRERHRTRPMLGGF